jgi:flagellar motor switch protein FliN/FliY
MKTSSAAREWIEQTLADAFGNALASLTGQSVQARRTAGTALSADSAAWFWSEFDEFPGASLLLGGAREAWLSIGRKLLSGAGSVDAKDEAILSAVQEAIANGVNTTASALSGRLKRSISAKAPRQLAEAPESLSPGSLAEFKIEFRDGMRSTLRLFVDPRLAAGLCAAERDGASGVPLNTKNLDLLLDVEMPVSVSFGRAQLPLKYLIKLTTGSIVELGRSVSEPVDIIVNNTVIARGEVVVVSGNFGVRIKEILSKQDRLRTLT